MSTKVQLDKKSNFSLVKLAYNITVYHSSVRIESLTNAFNVSGISHSVNFIELRDTDVYYRVESSDGYVSLGTHFANEMFIQWCYFRLSAGQVINYPEQLVIFQVLKTLSIVSCIRTVEDYYKHNKISCNFDGVVKIEKNKKDVLG